ALDIESTDGDLNILAGDSISAGGVTATEGDVILSATNNITTTSINSNENLGSGGAIDVDSTGGGTLDLGAVSGDGAANLDTTGALITAGGNVGGALVVGGTADPSSITFTGNFTAASMDLDTTGPVNTQDLSAPTGLIDIQAGTTITTGDVTADAVNFVGNGAIQTGNVTSNQSLSLAATGGSLTTGNVVVNNLGASVTLRASGATSDVTTGSVNSNGGDIFITAERDIMAAAVATALAGTPTAGTVGMHAGGSITAGQVDAGEDIRIESVGSTVTMAGATAGDDVVISAAGAINVTGPVVASGSGPDLFAVSFAGAPGVSNMVFGAESLLGSNIDIDTSAALNATDLTASAGGIDVDADSIVAGAVSATGGDALLTATGNVTTVSITAVTSGAGGAIDVDSTGGGILDIGDLSADTTIALDTTGTLAANTVTSVGALTVGATAQPSSVNFTGNVTAGSMDIDSTGALQALDLTATAGDIDVDTASIATNAVSATGGDVSLTTSGGITTASITAVTSGAGGAIDVDSTGGGTLDLGDLTADTTIDLDSSGTLAANTIAATGALTIGGTALPSSVSFTGNVSAGSMDIDATGPLTALDLDATAGAIDVDAGSILATNVSATAGVALDATGAITTGDIDGGGTINVASTGASVSTGDVVGNALGGSITLRAAGATSDVSAGTINSNSGDIFVSAERNITTGTVSTALAGAPTGGTIGLHAGGSIAAGQIAAGEDLLVESVGSTVTLAGVTVGDDATITAAGAIDLQGPVVADGSGPDVFSVMFAGAPGVSNLLFAAEALPKSNIVINTPAAVTATDLTASSGGIDIDAGSIAANTLAATDGDVELTGTGTITASSITASIGVMAMGGNIDVDSTGGGMLNLGDLAAGAGIALDTSSTLTANTVTSTGALTVGQTAMPTATTFTGNVTAGSMDIDGTATGTLNALDLTANAGDIDIDVGSITASNVSATGNAALDGAGTISLANATADSDTSGAGDLSIGTNTIPAQLNITGTASGVNTSLHADTLNVITATATGGDLVLSGGTVTVGAAQATNNVMADATTSITADTLTADSDMSGAGDLQVGLMTAPGQLTVNTAATGANVTLQAGQINAAAVTATAGNATLNASGNVTTSTITSTGGGIDVDSTGGGTLDLGDLTSSAGIALDTSGTLTANTATAVGALTVGQTAMPTATTFTGNVTAGSMDIDGAAAGTLTALDLTANAGDIDVDVGSITASNVSATGNAALDGAGTIAVATATADSDMSGAGDLTIGTNTIPAQLTVAGAASGVNASLHADVLNAATVTATGGDAVLSGGTISVGAVTATNDVIADATTSITLDTVTADSDMSGMGDVEIGQTTRPGQLSITTSVTGVNVTLEADNVNVINGLSTNGDNVIRGDSIALTDVTATGGDAILEATGSVTTNSITATSAGMSGGNIDVDSTGGGALDLGDLTADAGITLDTTGSMTAGAVTATDHLQIGGTASPSSVSLSGNVTAGSVEILSTGGIAAQDLTATAGDVDLDGSTITALDVSATGNVSADGAGAISLASAIADSDMIGTGDLSVGTNTAPSDLTIAGASSGANASLVSAGALTASTVEATAGTATLTADTVNADTVTATGGDAVLNTSGDATINAISAFTAGMAGGAIDVDSTGGGALSLGDVTADTDVAIDTTGSVAAGQVAAGGALTVGSTAVPSSITFTGNVSAASVGVETTGAISAQDVTATAGSITANAADITAGAVAATDAITLDAAGPINLASAVADSDNSGAGDLSIGTNTAPSDLTIPGDVSGANVTLVSAGAATTGAVSAGNGDTAITSAGDATIASVTTSELAVQSGGLLTVGAIDASGSAVLESADVDLQAAVDVDGASLTLRSAPGVSVGLGDGMGDYQLSDAELALIDTGTLVIDAVDQAIEVSGVSFTDQAGANEVVLATSGTGSLIRIVGDISGNGNGRIFRFGGDAAMGTMLAERITMDIEAASIDFGDATFDLRAEDIAFGNQELIDAVAGRDSGDLALNIVGDANSLLYNPLLAGGIGGARIADPVFLRAGNITVTYGNSALFQNTAPPQEGGTLFTGIELGQPGSNGTLALNTVDDTNTFAFFGQINELVGTAAALAGSNVILLGNDVRLPDTRVNGCVIGSGADCVTTIVGTTVISIPREVVELLTADAGLLVPFDPLVGTNNEGLFSDAATVPDEDCERDENGACVGP
ncbi:hypothetical protein, partial [uncultured Erythrobacter sp.]